MEDLSPLVQKGYREPVAWVPEKRADCAGNPELRVLRI